MPREASHMRCSQAAMHSMIWIGSRCIKVDHAEEMRRVSIACGSSFEGRFNPCKEHETDILRSSR